MARRVTEPVECHACHKIINIGQVIVNHHVSYYPEKIVKVHGRCHGLIHKSKSPYKDLQPNPAQTRRWYRSKGSYSDTFDPPWVILMHFDWFMDSVENGFWNEERKEREILKGIKKYWERVQQKEELEKRFIVKETWNSLDLVQSFNLTFESIQ